MAFTVEERFVLWGETGTQPSANSNFTGGDQVPHEWQNYLYHSLYEFENETRDALQDIDSDTDGVVDAADTAQLVKGNDIDSDGDGVVEHSMDASLYKSRDLDTDQFYVEASTTVTGTDHQVFATTLADGDTITAVEPSLTMADGSPAPSGVDLEFATIVSGSYATATTVLDGDGSTLFVDESSVSWTNNVGSEAVVVLNIENETGSNQAIAASATVHK